MDETDKKWGIILLAFGCFGIFQSYVLFMPVMFFSVLIFALVKQFLDKKLFSVNTIITGLGIFLPATLLGLWYTYGGIFGGSGKGGGGGTTVASAINIEGGIYSDLFSNFIFLIPIAFFGFISIIKNKKNKLITYVVALDIIFVLGLLRKALKREVSAYYYYKNYYMLWLLAWILFYIGICSLEKNSRFIAVFTMGLWILIAGMNWKNIEGRIAAKNPLLCQQFNTYNLSHIYGFNRTFIEITHYSADKVGIYTYVTDNIIDNDDSYVPLVGSIEDYFWMQAIINQSNSDFQYWNHGEDEFFNSLSADNVHYIMVFRDNSLYVNHSDYFEALNKIYENGAGFIGVVE